MDWSKIKTIFIISFLILDFYLIYEFLNIRNASQYELLAETSIDKQLKTDGIEYVELPTEDIKDNYLSAIPKSFKSEELKWYGNPKLSNQSIIFANKSYLLESVLKKPLKLGKGYEMSRLNNFINNHVIYGEQYRFWEINKEAKTITYYQQYKEKSFFKNIYGELTFYLNDRNEVISYKQTLLENIKELKEKEKILKPIEAIETLYEKGLIPPNSNISNVELGYYTLVHLTSSQVLTPAWRVVINGDQNLFVNAFEGQLIQLNNEDKKIVE